MMVRLRSGIGRYLLVVVMLLLCAAVPAHAQQGPTPLPADREECLPAPPTAAAKTPWPQQLLAPYRVWPVTKGAGVTVAVVDTGVDAATPQLAGRVRTGADVSPEGSGAADTDCLGHGTFVAGIIAAAPAQGTGFSGVAPEVTILPIRVATSLQPDEPGSLTPASLADGIRQAVEAGADVINVSAGTTVESAELNEAIAHAAERDVVVVASVSNNAQDGVSLTYPAGYPTVIAVGAIDARGAHASFSATGPFVDLVAPGVEIVSIGPRGGGQWLGSGTSYAAPFVAGTAALVRAYHPELTARQVKHRLEATANQPAGQLPHPALGWGTISPVAAVTAVLPAEGGAVGPRVEPPKAQPPPDRVVDELGPVIAVVAVLVAIAGTFAMVWVARLSGAGHRRRWRRARIARPTPTNDT